MEDNATNKGKYDDSGAYEALDVVSRKFLPIRFSESGAVDRHSHISEFINAILAINGTHPFVAIAPIFYKMRSWVSPERDGDRSEPLQFASSVDTIIKRLHWQVALTGARQDQDVRPRKGFTSTIIDLVNGRSDIERVIVVIRLGSTECCHRHMNDLCLNVTIPNCVQQKYVDFINRNHVDEPLSSDLKPGTMRPWDPKEPWKDKDSVKVSNRLDLSGCEPTFVSRSDGGDINADWHREIVSHANEHSLYIDRNHSLVYIFSNVVQVKKGATDYQRGCGGLFIVVNNAALEDPELTWLHQAKSLSDKLANRIIHDAQIDEIERQSRAAAISQVLARTLSHNLGSHSLNAFSGDGAMLGQFERLEMDINDSNPIPGRVVHSGTAKTERDSEEQIDTEKRRREWLATYNNYLRERMDFLADITTATPAFETRTHLVNELLKGYSDNLLLTTTIAGSPDFDYQWQPELGEGREDRIVAIPSDILGRHAFYIMLENMVRNSAKHGEHAACVAYSVKVEDMKGRHADRLKVTIKDSKPRKWTSVRKDEEGYSGSVNELVDDRNDNIKSAVLGGDGRVRDGAWGMLEMKACAAYLRSIPLENLDEDKYWPGGTSDDDLAQRTELPLLQAVGDQNGFGYMFFLNRPKRILFTGPAKEVLAKDKNEGNLRESGYLMENLRNIADGDDIYKHRLWCHMHTEANKQELEELIANLSRDPARFPHQVLVVHQGEVPDLDECIKDLPEHDRSLLERTIKVVPFEEASELPTGITPSEDDSLFIRLIGAWIKSSAQNKGFTYARTASVNPALKYLPEKLTGGRVGIPIVVDYAHHGPKTGFYTQLWPLLKLAYPPPPQDPLDIETSVLNERKWSGKRLIVPFASGVAHVMKEEAWQKDCDLALLHADYWLDEVAVIDERLQAAVHSGRYALENDWNEQVWVKHLADMSSVWIPPHKELLNLNATAYTKEMWGNGLLDWLRNHKADFDYVFIHLGVLEKFKPCMEGKSIADMLTEIRQARPGIRIVVTSGRGKPSNLPVGECFISYSAVAQYISQDTRRSPMLLHELARSARRIQSS